MITVRRAGYFGLGRRRGVAPKLRETGASGDDIITSLR
jgi:hypothetical protein